MLTAMGKWKELAVAKKIGLVVVGLFAVGAIGSAGQRLQTKIPATSQNQSEVNNVDISKQQPIDTTETKNVTATEVVPFEFTTQNDAILAAGTTKIAAVGVNGERTITYKVTYRDGKETSRTEVSSQITTQPITQVTKIGTKQTSQTSSSCDPNYSGCVPIASDVDCAGGSGNGPAYVAGPINVIGTDIYKLDSDHDGIACE